MKRATKKQIRKALKPLRDVCKEAVKTLKKIDVNALVKEALKKIDFNEIGKNVPPMAVNLSAADVQDTVDLIKNIIRNAPKMKTEEGTER